jgi:metal-responsive CopG/Arc/MetJ family transcriptional regulator
MERITVSFDAETRAHLEAEATRRGVSLSEFIRVAVENELIRQRMGAGVIGDSRGNLDAAQLTRENRLTWLEGFGEF